MRTSVTSDPKQLTDYQFRRVRIDLGEGRIEHEDVACADAEDFLGGIGRAFKSLAEHDVSDAYAPAAPLIMNLGVFSGTELMTGLRVFFSAYSPLKAANNGQPLAMWSTASGKFGTKMLAGGVDEVVFVGRSARPVYLLIRNEDGNLSLSLEDAGDLVGQTTHDKIMQLADRHTDSHVAALGPAGENWQKQRLRGDRLQHGQPIAVAAVQAPLRRTRRHGQRHGLEEPAGRRRPGARPEAR